MAFVQCKVFFKLCTDRIAGSEMGRMVRPLLSFSFSFFWLFQSVICAESRTEISFGGIRKFWKKV